MPELEQYIGLVDALECRTSIDATLDSKQLIRLRNSAYTDNLRVFSDQLKRPIGYVAWALIDKASARRLLRTGDLPFYLYEWSEGHICVIVDVALKPNPSREAQRQLRAFVKSRRAVMFVNRRGRRVLYIRRAGRLLRGKDRTVMPLPAVLAG